MVGVHDSRSEQLYERVVPEQQGSRKLHSSASNCALESIYPQYLAFAVYIKNSILFRNLRINPSKYQAHLPKMPSSSNHSNTYPTMFAFRPASAHQKPIRHTKRTSRADICTFIYPQFLCWHFSQSPQRRDALTLSAHRVMLSQVSRLMDARCDRREEQCINESIKHHAVSGCVTMYIYHILHTYICTLYTLIPNRVVALSQKVVFGPESSEHSILMHLFTMNVLNIHERLQGN